MKELAQEIMDMQLENLTNRRRVNELELETKRILLNMQKQIAEAVDESGKKLFSNDTLRKAELDSRLATATEYKTLENQIEALRENIQVTDIKVEFKKNLLRIALIESSDKVVLEVRK
jgi:polyhydroxyalkanoate synthesis regulator phasin